MEILDEKYGSVGPPRLSYFQLGRSLFQLNQFDSAESAFLNAFRHSGNRPEHWELDYFLGQCYENQNKKADAIRYYFAGALKSLDNFSFLIDRASNVVLDGDMDEILEFILGRTGGFKLTKDQQQEIDIFLSKIYLQKGNVARAVDYLNSISASGSSRLQVKALTILGELYYRTGQFAKAKEKLLEGISLGDDADRYPEIILQYIKVLLATHEDDEARERLAKINETGLNPKTKIQTAECYRQLGLFKESIGLLDQITEENKDELAYSIQVESYLGLRKYAVAQIAIEGALKIYSLSNDLFFLKIQLLIEGRLNIYEGMELFLKGYNLMVSREDIVRKVSNIDRRRPDDGHAQYFIAFIYFLLDENSELVNSHILRARKAFDEGGYEVAYPDTGLFVLEALVKMKKELTADAAIDFYEAGRRYYWQDDHTQAIYYLEKANQLNSSHPNTVWYLADSLRITSREDKPPFNNKSKIDYAYSLLESLREKVVVKGDDAWSYVVAGRIHEVRFKFVEERILDELWKATLYTERAAVYSKDNFVFWTDLGKLHNRLGLYENALYSIEKAIKLNPDDVYTLENKAIILLDSGKFEEATKLIEELSKKNNYEYVTWKGFIDFKTGEYNSAIEKFSKALKTIRDDIWSLVMRMRCYFRLKSFDNARNGANEILNQLTHFDDKREESTKGWAMFLRGDTRAAISILEHVCKIADDPYYESFTLCQFYLYENNVHKAADQFNNFMSTELRCVEINQLEEDLNAIEELSKVNNDPGRHMALTKLLNEPKTGWKQQLRARVEELRQGTKSLDQELEFVLANQKEESLARITLLAGRSRLKWDNKQYVDAYQAYKDLSRYSDKFPDVEVAIQKTLAEIIEQNKRYLQESKFKSVIEVLEAFKIDDSRVQALLVSAYIGLGNMDIAEKLLIKLLQKTNDSDSTTLLIAESIVSIQLFWGFIDLIKTCNVKYIDEHLQELLTKIESSIDTFWIKRFGSGKTESMLPLVTPVAIEISGNLIPTGPESEWRLLKEYAPHLRDDLLQNYNVHIPGIRLRGNETDLPDGTYILLIDEVPIVSGNVRMDQLFVPGQVSELDRLTISYIKTEHPLTGEKAAWVDQKLQPLLEENRITFWNDPFIYISNHLKSLLIRRLDYFCGVQETYNYLLNALAPDSKLSRIASRIQSSNTTLVVFNRVLKGLLRERVPITDVEKIILSFDTFKERKEINDLIQAIRLSLNEKLPGNNPTCKRIKLPSELERKIQVELKHDNGKTFLGIVPEVCQEVLSGIRDLVKGYNPNNIVLEIENTSLRTYVRKLIELEFVDVMVIAREEIIQSNTP